jgi:DNA primase
LNWAKSDVVVADQVVVCEGYTDVIGFHRAGLPRAVATCGTALTEEHFRLMQRFAHRVVLAFDADEAGQGAAERFYAWERKFDVAVSVARLPAGKDPADLAQSDPEALRAAVAGAQPFLGFRVERVLRGQPVRTPEQRAKVAEAAMAVVLEHPDVNVQKIYAGEIAAHCGLPVNDLVRMVGRGGRPRVVVPAEAAHEPRENAELVALGLLVHRWDDIAEFLVEPLFADDVNVGVFRALAQSGGDVFKAMEVADPQGRDLLERLAARGAPDNDPHVEVRTLVAAATRREIDRLTASARSVQSREDFAEASAEQSRALLLVAALDEPSRASTATDQLLTWLDRRNEERV